MESNGREESRRQFEDRLAAEGLDIGNYALEEKARREEAPNEAPIIATSKSVETQIIHTLKERERLDEDALTGAKNLRKYRNVAELLQAKAKAVRENPRRRMDKVNEQSFAVIILDIDHFKQINDTYGHAAGDMVLRELVRRIQETLRDGDLLARCGGEEFRIIALSANGSATKLAERIRRLIADSHFEIKDHTKKEHQIQVTASLGVSPYDEDTHNMELRSDAALYSAKGNERPHSDQRNQVWVWDSLQNRPVRYRPEKRAQPSGGASATLSN